MKTVLRYIKMTWFNVVDAYLLPNFPSNSGFSYIFASTSTTKGKQMLDESLES